MRNLLKVLLVPAGLALAAIPVQAAPANVAVPPAAEVTPNGADVAQVQYDRNWRRDRRYYRGYYYRPYNYRPYRPYYRPYYRPRYNYYTPRCYWSRYWQRRICR
ncbi:MAG: hypothetical protein ACREIP_04775 [Alphaproteobacteria bacterium]